MGKLKGKVAVITGGNSGIGLATAKEFVAQGAKVVVSGRDQKTLTEAAKELGPDALAVAGRRRSPRRRCFSPARTPRSFSVRKSSPTVA